ncbi:hypothetical protein [Actinomadura rugatobispora]|uniref:RING-type domain-containing protein n=1 Tax=Actinomadura rugatobispora TaxID=1994 RepID=A0ABW0ZX29_9ACTN|nr:hypothetical protein GCM10010200_089670 [Actinomadura rugatobispora]
MIVVPDAPWKCVLCFAEDQGIFAGLQCGHGGAVNKDPFHLACLWKWWTQGINTKMLEGQVNFVTSCPVCRTKVGENERATLLRQAFQEIEQPKNQYVQQFADEHDDIEIAFEKASQAIERLKAERQQGE